MSLTLTKRRSKMEMYAMMMKGVMSDGSEEVQALYNYKLQEYKESLSTEDEDMQSALMAAILSNALLLCASI